MRHSFRWALSFAPLLAVFVMIACGSSPTAAPASPASPPAPTTFVPTNLPATSLSATVSSLPPTRSTAQSIVITDTAGLSLQIVSFETEDGARLGGTLYGKGNQAVILSNTGDGLQSAWQDVPRQLAEQGYLVLTFDWRGLGASKGIRAPRLADRDLKAAIDYLRTQNVTRMALVGASLGGMASMKEGGAPEVAGVIVIGSPRGRTGLFQISDEDLAAIAGPKLFVASRDDKVVSYTETVELHESSASPKTLHLYDSPAHGTDILKTSDRDHFIALILDFVAATLPLTDR